MKREQLYSRLPIWAQHAAVSAEGWRINRVRYGGEFDAASDACRQRTFWSREQAAEFCDERLRAFVAEAVAWSPFYRARFAELGVRADDIRTLADLQRLPVLTRREVQSHVAELRSRRFADREIAWHHTSGSTGTGLVFPVTPQADAEQWSVWWRYRGWHGLTRQTPCLYFGGRSVVSPAQRRPPFWRHNWSGRQILFSGYHLGPDTAEHYLREMQRSRAAWIHGYPSLVTLIAQYAIDARVELPIRGVTLGAESLLPHQAAIIERAFGVRPRQHYGMAEGVANVSECPAGRLHVDEDFAAVEFLPLGDGTFRIVGTNFSNPAFPLLRYEVGDVATLADDACDCGRPGRVVRLIDGRIEDLVVTKRGTRLGRLDHIFKDAVCVHEAQIVQQHAGHMTVRVVKSPRFGEADHRALVRAIVERIGNDLDFDIVYTDKITRTAGGKLRFVVSQLADRAPLRGAA